ncbi:MAG: prepilin-type N-terminal cleavage/methylation domain-containing protein [Pyrinomonadaceae bacterium]|nr:prepilin-type N-terminal cleavage/methylation domain-containing protein [Phycisphaerales bacterium]
MLLSRFRDTRAFSLIELVIVIVIIGIIAAIAVPRMSRGVSGAADSALIANLSVLRNAVELYQTEHGGSYPTLTNLPNAMTQFTDVTGTAFSTTKNAATGIIYGPYLRDVPGLPVGADKGKKTFIATYTAGYGWVYDAATGTITANCPAAEVDARGVLYNTY